MGLLTVLKPATVSSRPMMIATKYPPNVCQTLSGSAGSSLLRVSWHQCL